MVTTDPSNKFILVGANPLNKLLIHPGGHLTACRGLLQYASKQGWTLYIVDTLQNSFPVPQLAKRMQRGFFRIINLIKYLNSENIKGVIIFSGAGVGFYERIFMSLICKLFGVKNMFFMRDGNFIKKIKNPKFLQLIDRCLLKIPDFFGSQGNYWSQIYQYCGVDKNKIIMARNWLSEECVISNEPKYVLKNKPVRFIFVGWLIKEKGVMELLCAIEELIKYYNFEFVIVGGGSLENYVRSKVRDLNGCKKIFVTGWLSNREVQYELDKAHVFVLPTYAEGFPNALLEAMAKGLPLISTKVGAISGSVYDGENGYLIEPRQTEQLMNAMKAYVLDLSLITKHSLKSLDIVKLNHDISTNCGAIFDVFLKQ